jgi:hypothetical protein
VERVLADRNDPERGCCSTPLSAVSMRVAAGYDLELRTGDITIMKPRRRPRPPS